MKTARHQDLEDVEANAPQGWAGTGKPMLIGSVYVERRLCDGQGLCSPGAWAPEDRCYPSSQLWTSISRLFLVTAESLSSVQLLSELALGRDAKSPFSQSVVDQVRGEVKVFWRAKASSLNECADRFQTSGGVVESGRRP